jgi:ADP-heptose:LPS heptosyltransferase
LLNQIVRKRGKPAPIEHQSLHYLRIAQDLGAEVSLAELSAREKTSNIQRPLRAIGSYEPEATSNIEVRGSNQPSPVRRSVGEGGTINHQPLLGLCPSAEYGPAKRWLPERFAEVAAAITARKQVQWLLFGTPQDVPVGEIIAKALGDNCVNRIGQTTIEQLIDELRTCRLLLTNDTGTMHLASLLGVPTVAIFGSTEPRLTGPLGNHHIVLRHQVECSPCFLRECPIDFRCMKEVATAEVIDAVLSMLR